MVSNSSSHYNVVIIGAGPGGLFATYEIVEKRRKNIDILVIDKGKPHTERDCQALRDKCINCKKCELICGGGGAGLFSDGKLVFDLYSGGYLKDFFSSKEKEILERKIRGIIEKFSLSYIYKKPHHAQEIVSCFENNNLKFKPYPVVHLGSNNLRSFCSRFMSYLQQRNVKFLFNTKVSSIKYDSSSKQWDIEVTGNTFPKKIGSRHVVVSAGKEGNFWFSSLVEKLGGEVEDNNTYIGVRMEINDSTARHLYSLSLDPKFCQCFGNIEIKTHCFCRHGQILLLKYFGLPLVGGHSPFLETDEDYGSAKFPNSSFAILYRDKKSCTWGKAVQIMEKVNKMMGGSLLVQRLGDYLDDVSTTAQKLKTNSIKPSNSNIIPGRVSEDIFPGFRDVFISFLKGLSSCIPSLMHPDNLLYAPAIEWWMRRIKINNKTEVFNLPNLYAVGDGSGWTQGIIQSAATGIIAATDILKELRTENLSLTETVSGSDENVEKGVQLCVY